MKIELKQRTFGELVGQSYSLAAAHFGKLFLIVFVFSIPIWAVQYWMLTAQEHAATPQEVIGISAVGTLLISLLGFILGPIEAGTCTLLVASSFTDDNPTVGDCLGLAFKKFGSLLGAAFTTGLIIGIGMVCLIVPGFIFMTWYFVTTPALVVEGLGSQEAMARSKTLTQGNRLDVFGYYLLTSLLLILISAAVSGIAGEFIESPLLSLGLQSIVGAAIATVGVVAPVVYYFNLRVKKEAFDIEALSSLVEAIGERGAAPK